MEKVAKKRPGRPKSKDKVQGLTIYVKTSEIEKEGGTDKCRDILKKLWHYR